MYAVSGEDAWGCPLAGVPEVVCLPTPVPGIAVSGSSLALNGAQDGWTWTWWQGDAQVGSGLTWEAEASGWYAAEGVDAVGCTAVTDSALVC